MAKIGQHFEERVIKRFLNPEYIMVGYELRGKIGKYEDVGVYKLPEEIKQKTKEVIEFLEKTNFPKDKSYAVKVAEVEFDKNEVEYYARDFESQIKNGKQTLLFLDKMSDSNGNQVYAVIRNNKVVTAFFGKSYSMKHTDPKEKMRVDVLIEDIKQPAF